MEKLENRQKGLRQLFFPIFIEVLFFMLVGSIDTLMLSSVGDDKVGAVGAANTYLSVFTISFSVISTGVMAVMTQYIGADKNGVARQAKNIGVIFNGIVGGVLSMVLLFWSEPVLQVLGTADSSPEINIHEPSYYVQVNFAEGCPHGNSCVIDKEINASEIFYSRFNKILAILLNGNICLDTQDLRWI